MDIINELDENRFNKIDDLLAFISIYDDENRTNAYLEMLTQNKAYIENAVCVEAGCGFGILSEHMSKLGAKQVYAVETNIKMYQIAKKRLEKYDNVTVIHSDIQSFVPPEPVAVLVQELFGQMLYDEDILSLEKLQFKPSKVFPDHAILRGGCIDSKILKDDVIDKNVLEQLDGALVSGLFDDEDIELDFTVIEWKFGKPVFNTVCDISKYKGDVLYFGLEILNDNQPICQAGICDNWSYVWTPRTGNRFELSFQQMDRGTAVYFNWED